MLVTPPGPYRSLSLSVRSRSSLSRIRWRNSVLSLNASLVKVPCFSAFRLPFGAPDPSAPPRIDGCGKRSAASKRWRLPERQDATILVPRIETMRENGEGRALRGCLQIPSARRRPLSPLMAGVAVRGGFGLVSCPPVSTCWWCRSWSAPGTGAPDPGLACVRWYSASRSLTRAGRWCYGQFLRATAIIAPPAKGSLCGASKN
jgi:hypothetical protein